VLGSTDAQATPGSPRCRSPCCEGVAAGVAKHVGVRLELQTGAGGGALDHAREASHGTP
jgi:hypothetical protein